MNISEIEKKIPQEFYAILKNSHITEFRPSQEKAIAAGLLTQKNLLICTPTASGKTLVAELAFVTNILTGKGKAVYIVPLKALATEKYKEFKKKYVDVLKVAISIGDFDADDARLSYYDLILTTAEKFDSLLRHKTPWLNEIGTVIVDEAHMLNDSSRGPTLEIILTLAKELFRNAQIIALSATIGNPTELAEWLNANLVIDTWRPVALHKGIYHNGEIEFYE